MKFLLLVSLTFGSINAMAMHHDKGSKEEWKKKWDAMPFEDAKKMKTDMLAKKKSMIEEAQTCVDKTTDKKGIEACMDKMHSSMESMHKDMKSKMKK